MTPDDLPFLERLYASTREEELAVVSWTPEQKTAFLRMQFAAQHAHYQAHYAGAQFSVIERNGQPAGRLYVLRTPADFRVIDLALLPRYRGHGIGSGYLYALIHEAAQIGAQVSIHVERNNPALRLYQRLGFEQTAEHGIYWLLIRPATKELIRA